MLHASACACVRARARVCVCVCVCVCARTHTRECVFLLSLSVCACVYARARARVCVCERAHRKRERERERERERLFVGCLTSQQQASVSQGRICTDNFMCCHTEIEVADQTFYLTQSQYTDTGPTSPSADPITPGAWQGRHWSANF